MKISKDQVEHVAHLARLTLNRDELHIMTDQLDSILQYVEKLDQLNTEDVAPTFHVFAVSNAFRSDDIKQSLSQKDALMNAPEHNGEMFLVPRII